MSRVFDRTLLHLALIGALAASLGLAACGRKGPLDPPPSASLDGAAQADRSNPLSSPVSRPIGGQTQSGDTGVGPNGQPLAPKGQKKRLPLDVLLN